MVWLKGASSSAGGVKSHASQGKQVFNSIYDVGQTQMSLSSSSLHQMRCIPTDSYGNIEEDELSSSDDDS